MVCSQNNQFNSLYEFDCCFWNFIMTVKLLFYSRIKVPYPFQWGTPIFRASHVFGMMGAALVSSAEVYQLFLKILNSTRSSNSLYVKSHFWSIWQLFPLENYYYLFFVSNVEFFPWWNLECSQLVLSLLQPGFLVQHHLLHMCLAEALGFRWFLLPNN